MIIRHGLKMTGMPAWGPTRSDEQIWEIVAFLKLFPTMPAAEYGEAVAFYETRASGESSGEMPAGHH